MCEKPLLGHGEVKADTACRGEEVVELSGRGKIAKGEEVGGRSFILLLEEGANGC